AFNRPPLLPGGGVICANSAGPIALAPLINNVPSTMTSHTRPKPVAAIDRPIMNRLVRRRRAESGITPAPGLLLQAAQEPLRECQHDKGYYTRDQPDPDH